VIARASFICLCSVFLSAGSQTATKLKDVRTVFIGSFGDKPGAESLRGRVVSEIEKSHSLRIAKDMAQADVVLGGKGEVWVKEHFSLNPRSRSLGDARTVYAGYLSVELQGKRDETLWSYLAAPHSAGENVDRDLARLVVRKLTDAIAAEAGH
jgi:hypothetical protein